MIVHILRNSRITFCGLDAAFVRNVVRNDHVFGIAAALEDGTLCPRCSLAAGV